MGNKGQIKDAEIWKPGKKVVIHTGTHKNNITDLYRGKISYYSALFSCVLNLQELVKVKND